jgi:hypothetical protein
MVVVVALLVAAACPPPGAEARFTKREATDSTRVAWGFWHSLRPDRFDRRGFRCGPARVRIDWRQHLGDAMATAEMWGCRRERSPAIRLERPTIRRLSDVGACGIVTHEFGHLLGYRHVRKASQLMSGHPRHGAHPPARATWARAWSRCRNGL